ncbi:serine/arginine repetitive matrix protein 1-like [Panicum virgatum]|uniref:serine/arginine repetitive matrix protein 1-like n=1 Tax=Panicum virgatum TaxID=38727 RepID=UPI0019D549D8|nr:serine/arginine repetitive matrix protein 1-like [Panicum virgatum]
MDPRRALARARHPPDAMCPDADAENRQPSTLVQPLGAFLLPPPPLRKQRRALSRRRRKGEEESDCHRSATPPTDTRPRKRRTPRGKGRERRGGSLPPRRAQRRTTPLELPRADARTTTLRSQSGTTRPRPRLHHLSTVPSPFVLEPAGPYEKELIDAPDAQKTQEDDPDYEKPLRPRRTMKSYQDSTRGSSPKMKDEAKDDSSYTPSCLWRGDIKTENA